MFFSNKVKSQNKSKYRNHKQVLYLVAHIENIFIPAYYEKIMKYFTVHLKYFHSDWYLDLLLCHKHVFKYSSTKPNMQKML